MSRPPCRFFGTPAGCNRGNQCKFAHSPPTGNNATDTKILSTPGSSDGPPQTYSESSRPGGAGNPPPGVCWYFWEHGRCKKEFNCRRSHTQPQKTDITNSSTSSSAPTTVPGPVTPSTAVLQRIAPFLTEQGLSKMSGSATDGFFSQDPSTSLSPIEAHNALKRFLYDTFRFKTTFEMYAFLKPLNSATASNANWVCLVAFIVAEVGN